MDVGMREDLIVKVEGQRGKRSGVLEEFGIARSTYYKWGRAYRERGVLGLARAKTSRFWIWNRLTPSEVEKILEVARLHPELSARLLAIKVTDEEEFSVSESTLYRILKQNGLIMPRLLFEMPALREWKHKTTRPDELWQSDGTNLFVVGWGYDKLIPVEDDFSRKILAHDIRPDETAFSISDIVELAIESARKQDHLMDTQTMPKLYSDNGSGFTSRLLAGYLGIPMG